MTHQEDQSRWRASIEMEIPFHDVDMMEVVWHGHYPKYFEIARSHLLDTLDINYVQMRDSGYAWPIFDMAIRYVQPLRFQQKIVVTAWVTEWESRLRIKYLITDAATGARLTKGRTDQVAIHIETKEMQLVSPPILLEKLGVSA